MHANISRFTAQCSLIAALVVALIASPLGSAPAAAAVHRFPQPSAEATALWEEIKTDFHSVTYTNVVDYSAPTLSRADKANASKELRTRTGQQPDPAAVDALVRQWMGERLNLSPAFDAAKAELDTLMPQLITLAKTQGEQPDASILRANKEAILLGLAYVKTYYSTEIGGVSLFESIFADPAGFNSIRRISSIGQAGYTALKGKNTPQTYKIFIRPDTNIATLPELIRAKVQEAQPGTDMNTWLYANTKALVVDESPIKLFDKFLKYPELHLHLLPLLTLSGQHLYVGSMEHSIQYGMTSTYERSPEELRALIQQNLTEQKAYWDFWKRLSTAANVLDTHPHTVVYDTVNRGPSSGVNQSAQHSPQNGPGTDPAVREFYTPLDKWYPYVNVDAYAADPNVIFQAKKALGQPGTNTYTHEVTHNYEDKIWFNGLGTRSGVGPETYARGLFEIENNTQKEDGGHSSYNPYFNLNLAYELGENRVQNQSPQRFQNAADIQQYMQGLMDVIYSLDAMEAQAALKLPAEKRIWAFNKLSLLDDPARPNTKRDNFTRVSEADVANLTNINDIIDANLVSSRLVAKGANPIQTVRYDEYLVVSLLEPSYAAMQNDQGTVGGYQFRRNAYELLAEYGWDKGFIGYLSNRYPNDAQALAAIAADNGGTMNTFKKAMFDRRIKRLGEMKPAGGFADAAAMQAAMDEALKQDIALIEQYNGTRGTYQDGPPISAVNALKQRIFKSYLTQTRDFVDSIYKPREGKVTHDVTATVALSSEGQPRTFADADFALALTGTDAASKAVKGLPEDPVEATGNGSVALGSLEFTAPGTYTFTVAQVDRKQAKITYDLAPASVVVEVEWASESADPQAEQEIRAAGKDVLRIKRAVLTKNAQPVNALQFANVYTPEKGERVVSTVVEPIAIEDEILYNPNVPVGSPEKILNPGEEGQITVKTVQPTVDGQDVGEQIITRTQTKPMVKRQIERGKKAAVLTPAPKRQGSAPVALGAQVNLSADGQARPFGAGDFQVKLSRAQDTTATAVTGVAETPVAVGQDGRADFTTIVIRESGTFTFVIEQVKGTQDKVVYDLKPVTVTVTTQWRTRANGEDYLAIATVAYTKDGRSVDSAEFDNVYEPLKEERVTTTDSPIPVEDEILFNAEVLAGTPDRVVNDGEAGILRTTTTQMFIDGKPFGAPVVEQTVVKQMVKRQIERGTKQAPTPPDDAQSATPTDPAPAGPAPATQVFRMVLDLIIDAEHYEYVDGDLEVNIAPAQGTDASKIAGLPTSAVKVPADGRVVFPELSFSAAGTYEFNVTQKAASDMVVLRAQSVKFRAVVNETEVGGAPALVVSRLFYVVDDQEIEVVRQPGSADDSVKIEMKKLVIPVEESVVFDPQMLTTAPERVQSEGVAGEKVITSVSHMLDGKLVGEPQVSEKVTKQMVPRVIVRGSKVAPVTPQPEPQPEPSPAQPGKETVPAVPEKQKNSRGVHWGSADVSVPAQAGKLAVTGSSASAVLLAAATLAAAGIGLMRRRRNLR